METMALTILSVFAFIGAANVLFYIYRQLRPRYRDTGVRIILYLPQNSGSKPEYIIRQLYFEKLYEKLMAGRTVYVITDSHDEEALRFLDKLKESYPIEVLPDQTAYCMITEREK